MSWSCISFIAPSQETPLSSNRNALRLLGSLGVLGGLLLSVVGACLAVQEAALLDRAGGLSAIGTAADAAVVRHGETAVAVGAVGRGEVRDVLGYGVLAADGARVDAVALSCLGHGIVAAVEVFTVLQVLGEVVRLAGQLAVEPEEALLVG